ncbi:flavin reductase family protein [Rhodobacteraceae bacterium HSP-20]|uniref:Flavin reductase family protein n=1 Tax=Paragemmobacter amnigenus TaxID=2852097 RepID=A0ABS6J898_9RHOB|nr:flavin reductase family protein [Rhodobacter amnigenus]MBU9699969.1 flavin reductase family protein [Rhodobacter amnigenus]MBV4391196.1 flavin reductase family protein [Rhodobacter amnigenus]
MTQPQDPRRALRDAFGTFMTGVTIVTTRDGQGRPLGFTANSFASVSLDPALLLVQISQNSVNYVNFTTARGFAVNILSEGQKALSNTFARPSEDRFAGIDWQAGPAGSPILPDVSAWFDCALHQVVEAGDHAILLGRVEAFQATPAPGLGYYRGTYFTPVATQATVPTGPDIIVSAILERAGQVLLVDDGFGGLTLPTARVGRDGTTAALAALIAATGIEAAPGPLYSVFEDVARGQQHIAFRCPATAGTPAKGAFVDLTPASFAEVTDQALRTMLDRLAEESRMGNYGIYFGNQNAGQVALVAGEKTK